MLTFKKKKTTKLWKFEVELAGANVHVHARMYM
jgi:hypothetical protein